MFKSTVLKVCQKYFDRKICTFFGRGREMVENCKFNEGFRGQNLQQKFHSIVKFFMKYACMRKKVSDKSLLLKNKM